MAKKPVTVTLRKPSSAQPSDAPATVVSISERQADAFVDGGKAGFRTITLYLPEALADRLALHCRKTDRDMSALLSEILEGHLDALENPKPEIKNDDPVQALVKWVRENVARVASLRPAWLF
jgi:hypothetical protein